MRLQNLVGTPIVDTPRNIDGALHIGWNPTVVDHSLLGWFDQEKPFYSLAKRAFDFSAATFMLVVLLPIFAVVALLLFLEEPQSVFFRQQRIGRGARPFSMLKFRTMRPDRRQRAQTIDFTERRHRLKVAHDPRI